MIDGFRLQFTSDELKTHLKSRVDYHNTQIEVLTSLKSEKNELDTPENRQKLQEAFEIIRKAKHAGTDGDGMVEDSHSEQMVESVLSARHTEIDHETRERVAQHRDMIGLYTFYSSRLVPNELYRLSLQEVIDLEIFAYVEDPTRPRYMAKGMVSAGQSIRGMQRMIGAEKTLGSIGKSMLKESDGISKSWGKPAR